MWWNQESKSVEPIVLLSHKEIKFSFTFESCLHPTNFVSKGAISSMCQAHSPCGLYIMIRVTTRIYWMERTSSTVSALVLGRTWPALFFHSCLEFVMCLFHHWTFEELFPWKFNLWNACSNAWLVNLLILFSWAFREFISS